MSTFAGKAHRSKAVASLATKGRLEQEVIKRYTVQGFELHVVYMHVLGNHHLAGC